MKTITTAKLVKRELYVGGTVEQIAKRVFEICKTKNVKYNSARREITQEHLERLCKAIIRDINNNRQGWWGENRLEVNEKTDVVKMFLKVKSK